MPASLRYPQFRNYWLGLLMAVGAAMYYRSEEWEEDEEWDEEGDEPPPAPPADSTGDAWDDWE